MVLFRSFFLFSLLLPTLAFAHAKPEHQSPAAETTVSAPKEVRLDFNETLEPAFSLLTVYNTKNQAVSTARASVDEATHKTLSVPLPTLPAGLYTVRWAAVGPDGHRTKGSYSFSVK